MFRRLWQSSMIGLARSDRVTRTMQTMRATSGLSRRYVAGETADMGVERAIALRDTHAIRASLFYLGEYVQDAAGVATNLQNKLEITDRLSGSDLDVHISIDPTQIGHQITPELARENARRIAAQIGASIGTRAGVHALFLDMEDAALNDPTIALHNALQDEGLPVGLTLQAYLRRTESDLRQQIARGSKVRLVKGAFAAGRDIAFPTRAEIKANSRTLISLMLSSEARDTGFYPIIATHDTRLHAFAQAEARKNGWSPGTYEFEMLMGVRSDVAQALAAQGERIRLYIPFGKDWWPYAVRRIGENPANAVLLARSLFS